MPFNADSEGRLIGGRYALEFLIGRGGMGEVWRARHTDLKTTVAIKFLAGGFLASEGTRKRFLVEAQVAAKLKSKYAVQVFDFGFTDQAQPYLVMELLDGETLAARIKRERRLSPAVTLRFLAQSARALERAHVLGIVHRDFKPENILVTHDDGKELVKILDFGVAKLLFDLEDSESDVTAGRPPSNFSRSGGILGTPYFMAPEQITNASDLGPAADIWAFGVVAYVCLTGMMPFDGKTLPELFGNILKGRHVPPHVARPDLPDGFGAWFKRACEGNPAKRFASAREAAIELATALDLGDRGDEAQSTMRALLRSDDAASMGSMRVMGPSEPVYKRTPSSLAPKTPLASHLPPANGAPAGPSPIMTAADLEEVRHEERSRAYSLAIGAFVLGAVLALAVERLGIWLGRR